MPTLAGYQAGTTHTASGSCTIQKEPDGFGGYLMEVPGAIAGFASLAYDPSTDEPAYLGTTGGSDYPNLSAPYEYGFGAWSAVVLDVTFSTGGGFSYRSADGTTTPVGYDETKVQFARWDLAPSAFKVPNTTGSIFMSDRTADRYAGETYLDTPIAFGTGRASSPATPLAGPQTLYDELGNALAAVNWIDSNHSADYVFPSLTNYTGTGVFGVYVLPGAWHGAWPATDPTVTVSWTLTLYHGVQVLSTDGSIYPPSDGSDSQNRFGLSSDRTFDEQTRQVFNTGFNSDAITFRRWFDPEATASDVTLSFSGRSPSIACLENGTHLVACTDGSSISIHRIDDEGVEVETMPSPGAGALCDILRSRDDDAPALVAFCDAATGTANIKAYRTFDLDGLTGWESAVTVISSVPAQKPSIIGNGGEAQVWYHDATPTLQGKRSLDQGATWSAI